MKIYSVSGADLLHKSSQRRSLKQVNPDFRGKHTCRNTGLGAGSLISLVGFGLWNVATGGVPLIIGALAAAGTAAAGAFGDALDKSIEEEENKNKK